MPTRLLVLVAVTGCVRVPGFSGGDDSVTVDGGGSSSGGDGALLDGGSDGSASDGDPGTSTGGDGGTQSVTPPSCATLPATCVAGTSCCLSTVVPATSYYRQYDVGLDARSGDTSLPAQVRSFRLDAYEVTVGRYRAFLDAGKGTQLSPPAVGAGAHPWIPNSGWQAGWSSFLPANWNQASIDLQCVANYATWSYPASTFEQRPINCVNWYEAMAFCAWDGGFLPTEAEWNAAASGGDQHRVYPWSSPPTSTELSASHASYGCQGDNLEGCLNTDIIPVGTRSWGAGRWGQFELAGNVAEWMSDVGETPIVPCTDCVNAGGSQSRVYRGGAFGNQPYELRITERRWIAGSWRGYQVGFRCARPL